MKIVRERQRIGVEITEFCFYEKETNEVRWGFPMTNGKITPTDADGNPCSKEDCLWWKNYLNACSDENLYGKVDTYKDFYTKPAVGLCSCGNHVELTDQFYGSCECSKCGQWYTLTGQECLSPDEQRKCQDW